MPLNSSCSLVKRLWGYKPFVVVGESAYVCEEAGRPYQFKLRCGKPYWSELERSKFKNTMFQISTSYKLYSMMIKRINSTFILAGTSDGILRVGTVNYERAAKDSYLTLKQWKFNGTQQTVKTKLERDKLLRGDVGIYFGEGQSNCFQCRGEHHFASGIVWSLQKGNVKEYFGRDSPLVEDQTIFREFGSLSVFCPKMTVDMKAVTCHAPIWNSISDWRNTTPYLLNVIRKQGQIDAGIIIINFYFSNG